MAKIINIPVLEKGSQYIERTSQLINDGENGNSYFIEETELENTLEDYELIVNKQNDLTPDSTGTKYPTVDAVNEKIQELEESINHVSGDKHYTYEQDTPSTVWDFQHPLNKKPSVVVTDSAGTVIVGQVVINDGTNVKIEFNSPIWGYAICN